MPNDQIPPGWRATEYTLLNDDGAIVKQVIRQPDNKWSAWKRAKDGVGFVRVRRRFDDPGAAIAALEEVEQK